MAFGSITERLAIIIDADGKGAVSEFKAVGQSAERELGKAESKAAKVGGALTKIGAGATVAGAVMVAGLSKAAQKASDLEQATGAVESVFGEAKASVEKFAKSAATEVGLSERATKELASTVGALAQGYGFTRQESAKFSEQVIKLGADLSATFGGTTQEAVEAIGAAFRGERDPIEKYGVAIKDADVKARVAALGLDTSTVAAQKNAQAQATLSLILENTATSAGAFARESDTLAHKQQVSAAEAENAAAALGEGFKPVLEKVTGLAAEASQAFLKLDKATGGLASQVAGIGAVSLVAGGGLAVLAGHAIKSFGSIKSSVETAVDSFREFRSNLAEARASGLSTAQALSNVGTKTLAVTSIVGAGAIALGAWAKAKANARQRTLEFVEALEADNGALGDNTRLLLSNKIAQADLNDNLVKAGLTYDEFVNALKRGGDEGKRVIDQLRQRGKLTGEEQLRLGELIQAYGNATREMQENEAAGIGVSGATGDVTRQVAGLTQGLGGLSDETEDATAKAKALDSAFRQQIDTLFGAQEATSGYYDKLDALTEAFEKNKGTVDLHTQAGRDNAAAIRDLVEATGELVAKQIEEGATAAEIHGTLDTSRQKLVDLANTYNLPIDQVQTFIDKLDAIPEFKEAKLKFTVEAQQALADAGLGGSSMAAEIARAISGARADGGPVTAGKAYLVGERGPELFTPGTSGTVHANGSFGGNTYQINVQAFDRNGVPEAVVEGIRRANRMGLTSLVA